MKEWEELGGLLDRADGTVWLAGKLLKVRSRSGALTPLVANTAQETFEQRRSTENIVLKARQMGMSTWVAGRFLLRTVLLPGTTTLLVAHTRESAEALLAVVKRMWENLPTELIHGPARVGLCNSGQMTFPLIDSEFRVASAADANAGRGLSVQNLHLSEVARWSGDAAETLAGLRAALAPGGEMVMESTANGAYGCFYEQWMAAEENGIVRHFLPWWMEPAYVGAPAGDATAEESALMLREGLSAEQVGFRRELLRRYGAMREQEFPESDTECFRMSGSCFFERDALDARIRSVGDPIEVRLGGALLVWLPPIAGRKYVVAADAAGGGSGGDFAAVQVVDAATGMQCAELRGRMAPREMAAAAAALAREYRDALLVVERNNHGMAVLAHLEGESLRGGSRLRIFEDSDGGAGWLTDSASRPQMLAGLARLVSSSAGLLMSRRLLEEMRSFVVDERGRAAAASGAHDDLVMSMAIAQAVRG